MGARGDRSIDESGVQCEGAQALSSSLLVLEALEALERWRRARYLASILRKKRGKKHTITMM